MSLTLNNRQSLFQRLSVVTLISVYLLILVGGIVRSTGSGMGCPDWPRCFGSWVPPTEVSQLPADYKEVYARQRVEKNERLIGYLEALSFTDLASRMREDKSIPEETGFNVNKTWTEYVNRLVGVVIGLLIFATFLASLTYRKTDPLLTLLAFASFVVVGFQGWVGSIVVSTNLLPGMITFHMLLALLLVCMLIYLVFRAQGRKSINEKVQGAAFRLSGIVLLLLSVTLVQIVVGTQVRESVDEAAKVLGEGQRGDWIEALGGVFTLHRSISYLVLAAHVYALALIYQRFGRSGNLTRWGLVLIMIIGLEILSGAIMAYFGVPRFAQPIHLLLATVAFGVQFYLLLLLNQTRLLPKRLSSEIQEYASC